MLVTIRSELRSSQMTSMSTSDAQVLYLATFAAPAASRVTDFIQRAVAGTGDRHTYGVAVRRRRPGSRTSLAIGFERISGCQARQTSHLLRTQWWRRLPRSTVVKSAAGMTDTFAAGLLGELTGMGVPIVAVPLVKDSLAKDVLFARSWTCCAAWGSGAV